MKYKLESLLALNLITSKLLSKINKAEIAQGKDEDLWLVFEADVEIKGSYKKRLKDLLWAPVKEQYNALVATDLLAKGYLCIPIEGGWIVKSPEGEEYQLTENTCTCAGFTYDKEGKPCKHLRLRDFLNQYRARVNKEKLDRGLI